jgi:hypothetical protein
MITHELVIGYPHALKRSLLFSAPRNVGLVFAERAPRGG